LQVGGGGMKGGEERARGRWAGFGIDAGCRRRPGGLRLGPDGAGSRVGIFWWMGAAFPSN